MLAQHWLMSKAICFNNWPPFSPHLVINTALLLSLTFCKINRSEAPSSLFISFQIIHSIFDFWSFPRKIFAIFGEEMFNFLKSWIVTFFQWWRRWWCSKTASSQTFADAARPALHLRVHPAALPTQDNLLRWLATLPGPAAQVSPGCNWDCVTWLAF